MTKHIEALSTDDPILVGIISRCSHLCLVVKLSYGNLCLLRLTDRFLRCCSCKLGHENKLWHATLEDSKHFRQEFKAQLDHVATHLFHKLRQKLYRNLKCMIVV